MIRGKGERILLIDDEPSVTASVSQYLKLEGFAPFIENNGKNGLEWLKTNRADLVLLDVNMPEMDGVQVLRAIKKDKKLQHIPVIFLTANSEEAQQLQGWQGGAAHYITKPFDMNELISAIQLTLEEKRRQIVEHKEYEL